MNILNKLTIKHLKMNKKRTIVTIIGVILSCALMVGIGLLFSTFRDYMIQETISYSGSQHVIYKKMDPSKQEILKSNKNIQEYYSSQLLGYSNHESLNQEIHQYIAVINGSKNFLDTVEINQGRMPNNENEIVLPSHVNYEKDQEIKIGDTITLNIGDRSLDGNELLDEEEYIEGETLQNTKEKTYKVVGIIDRSIYEEYQVPAYYAITTSKNLDKDIATNFYVTFKKEKNIVNQGNVLAKHLGIQSEKEDGKEYYNLEKVEYNYNLLSFYGESNYDNFNTGMSMVISTILLLISVGCTIVIYNSFAISVMERKKQFGLFSSIGTTKKQLRHTVFFEALIVGIIGIPIGILSGFIGIGTVLAIMKNLVPDLFGNLHLTVYPLFLIIPILFMIIVIFASALIPAKLASRVSPIEAIRQNDDIKIKNRKVKSNRLIKKLFGIEGDLAYKNIKRNKKKYRITIVSLFISIVLFISFSSFLQYGIMSSNDYLDTPESDILITFEEDDISKVDQVVQKINNLDHIDESTYLHLKYSLIKNIEYKNLTQQAQNYILEENWEKYNYALMINLSEKDYQQFQKETEIKDADIILINNISGISYKENNRISYNVPYFKTVPDKIELCTVEYSDGKVNENGEYEEPDITKEECNRSLSNITETKTIPYGIKDLTNQEITLIVSQEQFDKLEKGQSHYLLISSKKASKIDEDIQKILKESGLQYFYENVAKEMQMVKNLTLVIQILLYGFISLVTLIGVTSVFNTINTSIALRRREFAMLRSVGLTPHGLNKIMIFESIFFGIKSLLYGLPVGCAISYWFYLSFSNFSSYEHFTLPYKSILITVIGVFIIVYATMTYASKKIKKENILEAIREENI